MALLRCDFTSEVLKMDTSMTVILPQDLHTPFSPEPAPIPTAPPVLYLLHIVDEQNKFGPDLRRSLVDQVSRQLLLAFMIDVPPNPGHCE